MTPTDCIRIAAAEHDVPEARLVGPYKRPRAIAMARALGVDWSSIRHLARRVWE